LKLKKKSAMFSPPWSRHHPARYALATQTEKYSEGRRAQARYDRLHKASNNVPLAIFYDVLYGAVPWLVGVAAVTSILFAIHEADEEAQRIFPQLHAPVAVGTVSTFAAFLLVSKIQANLACNAKVIGEFGNLTGALVNLALFVKSQGITVGWGVETIKRASGNKDESLPSTYETTRLALVLASVPYIVKYNGRHVQVIPELLPLGQDRELVQIFERYVSESGSTERMSDFTAIVLMISECVDAIQHNATKDTQYLVLFDQLNALTAAEGTIASTAGYQPPYILDAMLYVVFILFMLLLVIGDLIPTNRGNAVWLAGLVVLCTAVFFQISDRYWNPMALRSKRSGQAPLVSKACVAAEIAIIKIFSKPKSRRLSNVAAQARGARAGAGAGAAAAAAAAELPPELRFSFGL